MVILQPVIKKRFRKVNNDVVVLFVLEFSRPLTNANFIFTTFSLACVADETKPRYSPSANQRPLACSAPRVLPGFFIIGSNWLLHMAVLSCTVIGRVDLVEPWLRSR